MGFWRHELGAIVVVALKNTLKRSGLGYGKLPWPIGGRQIADSMTTKALELDGKRRFLLRLDELCVALPNAARYREAASKGCNGWRVDKLTATRQHLEFTRIAKTIEKRKGKEA